MQFDHTFKELDLAFDDVEKLLAGFGDCRKADKVNGVPGVQGVADFTVRLESADAWPFPGAWVHHNDRAFFWIDYDTRGRNDPRQRVVHWARKCLTAHDFLLPEAQDRCRWARLHLDLFVAALA